MKKKIVICLVILIIAVGTIFTCIKGFNFDTNYKASIRIQIQMEESFEMSDIESIAKSVFPEDRIIEITYADTFNALPVIHVTSATNEELENLENKLREKYSFKAENEEENAEESSEEEMDGQVLYVMNLSDESIYDLIRGYITPIIITFVITVIFLGIYYGWYKKLGVVNGVIIPVAVIFAVNALYISIISICRVPVNEYVIAVGLFVYTISLIASCIVNKNK